MDKFQRQPMPFDGFLFASRVMVAKEAHTSPSVKDLIVQALGVPDGEWEGTYAGLLTSPSNSWIPTSKLVGILMGHLTRGSESCA